MPVYDYLCDHCGHAFAATSGFNDPQLSACPRCGKPPRRLISATAIVFKGSGWYKTDSRSAPKEGGDAKPAATGAKATATGDAAAATSGDAKPGDATSGDTTSGDTTSGPAKSGDAKSAGSKAAAAPASASKVPAKGKPASSS